jgi:hypothetical protein
MFKIPYALLLSSIAYVATAQHSRLSVELIGFIDEHFSYINKSTLPTTSDRFAGNTPFGGTFTKNNPSMFQYKSNNSSLYFEQALLFNYKYNEKWIMRYGIIYSYAGSSSSPSGILGVTGTGASSRFYRFSVMPSYLFYNNTKYKVTAAFSAGPSLDYLRDDWGNPLSFEDPTVGFMFSHNTEKIRRWSTSLHTGIRLRFELKNGNAIGFHTMAGLGLLPVIKNCYRYRIDYVDYYTEMLSNGSYLRIGIGYEFQIMRNKFRYQTPNILKNKSE